MIFLILIFTLLAFVFISWINLFRDSKKLNIPGNFFIPILGNGHEFLGGTDAFLRILNEMCATYNDAARFYLGSARYVVISHPRYVEPLVSSTELITKGKSYSFLKDWLGSGLLTSTGQRWRTHRKFLTPAFHFNILQNFMPVFVKNERILCKKLKSLADGRPINLFPIIALNALDNVVESIMGVSVNAQENAESEYVKAIEILSDVVTLRIRNPMFANDTIFNLTRHKTRQDNALIVLHGQTRAVIEARKEELKTIKKSSLGNESELGIRNKHAFLDLLLLAETDGQRLDDEKIREEVDTFMFEGHDTTTSGITFCLYNISRHKNVQQKLYEEQKAIFGDDMDRDPTFNEIREMKYLDTVLKESQRLHPSVPIIERSITHDTDLGGLRIPKDTNVLVNIMQMHRNPKIYEEPLSFKPERFEEQDANKNAFSWMPFSAGPRNCIGQKYALLEMKVSISGIIRQFELLPSGEEPILCEELVLRSKNGVHVKILPRNNTFN